MPKLYHYTTVEGAKSLLVQGITPTPLAIPGGAVTQPVVSLTSNERPKSMVGKSLTDGRPLEGDNLRAWCDAEGHPYSPTLKVPTKNTAEARVTVLITPGDVNLLRLDLSNALKLGFPDEPTFRTFLHLGGGRASEWWVYTGLLPASLITAARTGRNYKVVVDA